MGPDSEASIRRALSRLRAGAVTHDVANRTLLLDAASAALLDLEEGPLGEDRLAELVAPEHREELVSQLALARSDTPPREIYFAIRSHASTRWLCLVEGAPDAAGRREATLVDVTAHENDRRALFRQLRHNETFARLAAQLLEASSLDACLAATQAEIAGPLGLDVAVVESFEEGSDAQLQAERFARRWGEVAHFPDARTLRDEPLREALAVPRLRTLLTAPIVVDGVLLGAVSAGSLDHVRMLVEDDLAFFGSVIALVSGAVAAKRLAAANREMEAKLAQSQKMESLGMLAGGVAHDFNNLLVGILGNASLALLELPDDSPVREELKNLRLAALRASDLTRQLLAYAGRGPLSVKRVDVRQVLDEMRALLGAAIPKNVTVAYELEEGPVLVDGDVTQLRQVFMNLITNASDAIGKSEGLISVSAKRQRLPMSHFSDAIVPDAPPSDAYVVVTVSDTGCGMPPEVRSRIFDPFFTTKPTGRGLGLAAVLGILRTHHGTVRVETTPGRGTTFEVIFPALEGVHHPSSMSGRSEAPTSGSGCGKVLVIDDEPVVRTVAQRALERAGFEVLVAEDGVEGVAAFRAHAHDLICILLDSAMPRMSGSEALSKIRELDRDIPVVVSSGYAKEDFVVHDERVAFLPKPFDPPKLVASIMDAVHSRRQRSE